ncbi:MAG: hypothetical protein KJ626_02900 [Verrucomicrobia bacterium]|nr:hypothetical protein [Verrucomicrobiota bacterium]
MKKLVIMIACSVIAATVLADGINWSAYNNYLFESNGTTKLNGDTLSSVGSFVQLLWVGGDGVVGDAGTTGDGTILGNDIVVDTWWVGGGNGGLDGWFDLASVTEDGSNPNVVENRWYFGRVWNAPSPNFAGGDVPTGASVRYANSSTWQYPSTLPTGDTFDITQSVSLSTTLSAVPEPTVLGLGLIGLMVVRLIRRRK